MSLGFRNIYGVRGSSPGTFTDQRYKNIFILGNLVDHPTNLGTASEAQWCSPHPCESAQFHSELHKEQTHFQSPSYFGQVLDTLTVRASLSSSPVTGILELQQCFSLFLSDSYADFSIHGCPTHPTFLHSHQIWANGLCPLPQVAQSQA